MTYWDGTRWVPEAPTSTPTPRRGRRLFGAVAEASLITLLIFGLIAGTAFAAKGGNGNGRGGSPPAAELTATLAATCAPCGAGYVAFEGAGYDASKAAAQLWVSGAMAAIPVYEDGSVSFSWYFSVPATYEVRVYQAGNGKHKMVLMAQTTVVVQ